MLALPEQHVQCCYMEIQSAPLLLLAIDIISKELLTIIIRIEVVLIEVSWYCVVL